MSFKSLRCREKQDRLYVYWEKGSNNLADYFTKQILPQASYHNAASFSTYGKMSTYGKLSCDNN